jgi:putative salt-induced outer membrane protein
MTRRFRAVVLPLVSVIPVTLTAQDAPPKTFEGAASLGFAQTNGNANATTINVSDKIKYRMKGWAVGQDLAFFYGEAEGKVNANFWNGGVRGERRLTPRLGMFVGTRFDRNVLQGVASRFEEGVGFDVTAIDAKRDKLVLSAGASLFQQTLVPGAVVTFKRNFPAARAALDYKHSFSEVAYFQQMAEYLPNLSDPEVYLLNTESSIVAPLASKLGLKMSYVVRYNSTPPFKNAVQLRTTDTFFTSAITYAF